MPVMDQACAGVDVHQKTGVAGMLRPDGQGGWDHEIRPCGTMTADVLARCDGRLACGCTHVALERTGDDWTPVFDRLAGRGEGWLVKAQHVKAGPGRQTDVNEAAWRAELLPHGLWRARGIPPVAQRQRRDLRRDRRPVIQARVTLRNRGPTRWADATLTRAAVASEILGARGGPSWRRGSRVLPPPRPSPSGPKAAGAAHGTRGRRPWQAG
jgi:transposase